MKIGPYELKIPLIQGGMGVGVSLGNLAGHVAFNHCMGVISSAQIGFKEKDFYTNTKKANLRAIDQEIKKAKQIASGNGIIAMNIMTALSDYKDHVVQSVKSGADAIISGAGLPLKLPEYVNKETLIAPIVSSGKAARLILKSWDRHYHRIADFIVIESSLAGGHLGFKKTDLINQTCQSLEEILKDVKEIIIEFALKYHKSIPIFVAGGIFDSKDIRHFMMLNADGVQIGTRFIGTHECDASPIYKNAFIQAKKEDITLVTSPVGMPGRAMRNVFILKTEKGKIPIHRCFRCISSCDVIHAPYCITEALIRAVNGDLDNGLIFTGSNGYRIDKIISVKELINELKGAFI